MIKDTKANLEAAAAGEKMEWTMLYPDFGKIARDEGYPEAARTFDQIAKAEKFHESRYRKLIENVSKGEVFKRTSAVKWHCINCGYIFEGTKATSLRRNARRAVTRRRSTKCSRRTTRRRSGMFRGHMSGGRLIRGGEPAYPAAGIPHGKRPPGPP